MRIATVQLEITPNRELIVLPEAFNTGFYPENYEKVENLEKELKPILED